MTDLTKNILESKELSDKSKKNYSEFFNSLHNRLNKFDKLNDSLEEIATNASKYIPVFKKWFAKDATLKVYISAIQCLFKYNKEFKEHNIKEHEKWGEAYKEVAKKVTERYEENKPSDIQSNGYVPYEDIIKMRNQLKDDDKEKLLLGMYTYIRPLRCEYSRVRIYKTRVPKDNKEPNYIVLKTKKSEMIIKDFKTRKSHSPIEIELPDELVELINKSVEKEPREWLFVDSNKEPYTRQLYIKWVGRVFRRLFDRPLTVSLIRHAFINTLDFNTLSIAEKKEIAESMGHTHEMQDKYRLIFTDKKQKCDCVCESKKTNE
ncbi:MAG: hypothetical protein EBU66_14790 [Bacteroidetes bacterium]|nr:hypothetical protein [Bacteroidota bacterium]